MRRAASRTARILPLLLLGLAAPAPAQPARWTSVGVGGGGAFFAPSWSPHLPGELWVASDMSGVYRSTDAGARWDLLDFREIQGGRTAVVQFTSDPAVLYTLDRSFDSATPSRSGDGGRTWTPLPADPTFGGAYSIHADPASTQRLLVSDYSNLYFSGNGGAGFSTVYTNPNGGNGLWIAGAFFDGQTITVGTSVGLVVSNDGGQSFGLAPVPGIPAGEAMISFAGAREGAEVRFFCVTAVAGDVYPGLYFETTYLSYRGVYVLEGGMNAWVPRANGIPAGDFPLFVSMSANDVSIAWIAGQRDNEDPIVYRTTDAGLNWTSVLATAGNGNIVTGWSGWQGDRQWSYGAGALGFRVAPDDPDRAAWTDLGFVHVTTDGGATWRQAYVDPRDGNPAGAATPRGRPYRGIGLEDTTCWGVTWTGPSRVFASFTDIRGIATDDGGASWSFDYTGHTLNTMYRAIVHPSGGTLYAATSSVHDLYASTYLTDARIDGGTGQVLFSADEGRTWQVLHDFGHPVVWVAADPTRPARLYASVVHSAAGGIYVSDDIQNGAASAWARLPNPPRTQGHPLAIVVLSDGDVVASFSGRRAGSPLVFTDSSGVFLSEDGGQTWQDRTGPDMHWWVKDVVVDPHDPSESTWYAGVFSAWGGFGNDRGGLYRTTDRGLSWERILQGASVDSCTISPVNPEEMYVTTEQAGLWHTLDRRSAAPAFRTLPEYPFRYPLRVFWNPYDPEEIWATSFGNGIRIGRTGVPAPRPMPVADGRFVAGAPLRVAKLQPDGSSLRVTWDVTICEPAADYSLLHGSGSGLPGYALSGAACGLGVSGSHDWTPAPAPPPGERLLWLVMAGTDGLGSESSWGRDSTGAERRPGGASGLCGATVKDTSATCP